MANRKRISYKLILTVFAVLTSLLTAARIYQLFSVTENDATGFFKINHEASAYILYIAAALGLLAVMVLVTFSHSVTASKPYRGKSKLLSVSSGVLAAGIAVDVALGISRFMSGYSVAPNDEKLAFLFENGLIFGLLEAVFGLLACIYLIIYALSYAEGRQKFGEYRLLALTPLMWAMSRMVARFMTKISFTVVADLTLELIMLAFMMLFFISFARISSQVCQKNEMRKAMSCGLIAAGFAIAVGVSRLVVTVAGSSALLPLKFGITLNIADLAFGFFAVAFVYTAFNSGRDASEDDLIEDETESSELNEIDEDFLDD